MCKISKKSSEWIQSYEEEPFLGPKRSVWHKREKFLRKTITKPCCAHLCLSACKKSESDINH